MEERDFSQRAVWSGSPMITQGEMRQDPLLVSWFYQFPGNLGGEDMNMEKKRVTVVPLAPDASGDKLSCLHSSGLRDDSAL